MKILMPFFTLERLIKGVIRQIKRFYFYQKFHSYGHNVRISPKIKLYWPEKIKIGNNIFIEEGAHFSCREGLSIGNNCMMGPNVTIIGGDHETKISEKSMFEYSYGIDKKIIIEDDVWIGANVIILKNALIRQGCIIGAGSVVTKSTKPYGVYAGNPAKLIKYREKDL